MALDKTYNYIPYLYLFVELIGYCNIQYLNAAKDYHDREGYLKKSIEERKK